MKKIIKNQKIIILIAIILIIIIGITTFLIVRQSNNNSLKPNNKQENISKIKDFQVSNLEVDLTEVNVIKIFFKLENIGSKDIKNKPLEVNFYNNKDLIVTYSYLIEDLKINENTYIQGTINYPYQEINKYEFIIDDYKVFVEPTNLK